MYALIGRSFDDDNDDNDDNDDGDYHIICISYAVLLHMHFIRCSLDGVRTLPKAIRSLCLEKNNKQHDHHHTHLIRCSFVFPARAG